MSVIDPQGKIPIYTTTNPPATASGVTVFTRYRAGKYSQAYIDQHGIVTELASLESTRKTRTMEAVGAGSSVLSVYAMAAPVAIGTATAVALDSSTILGSFNRLSYVSAASAGAGAGTCTGGRYFSQSANTGLYMVARGNLAVAAGSAVTIGLFNASAALGNVDTSTLARVFGFGADSADSLLQFMHNDASGTCTKTALPANWTKTMTDPLEVRLYLPKGGTTFYASIENLATGEVLDFSANTNIPTDRTNLGFHWAANTRAGTAAITTALSSLYTAALL